MKKRVSGEEDPLRQRLRDHYAERLARYSGIPGFRDGHAQHVVDALDAGEPVVLQGSALFGLRLPEVRSGAHFYRVVSTGRGYPWIY